MFTYYYHARDRFYTRTIDAHPFDHVLWSAMRTSRTSGHTGSMERQKVMMGTAPLVG
jgi:hypothetical protein